MSPLDGTSAAALFTQHRRALWAVAYRLTGTLEDADDVVQETFVHFLAKPPADLQAPLLPWLVRVAANLGKDALRRRKRRKYTGPWLPAAVGGDVNDASVDERLCPPELAVSAEQRCVLRESATLAFLVELEGLTPQQRAVFLLRDVLDHSGLECASALSMSEANVKVTLHRARKRMALNVDRIDDLAFSARATKTQETLMQLLQAFLSGNVKQVESLLRTDIVSTGDGAGIYAAAAHPLRGAARVAAFFTGLATKFPPNEARLVKVNGLPAVELLIETDVTALAPRTVFCIDVDDDGKVRAIFSILAPKKIAGVAASS